MLSIVVLSSDFIPLHRNISHISRDPGFGSLSYPLAGLSRILSCAMGHGEFGRCRASALPLQFPFRSFEYFRFLSLGPVYRASAFCIDDKATFDSTILLRRAPLTSPALCFHLADPILSFISDHWPYTYFLCLERFSYVNRPSTLHWA